MVMVMVIVMVMVRGTGQARLSGVFLHKRKVWYNYSVNRTPLEFVRVLKIFVLCNRRVVQ